MNDINAANLAETSSQLGPYRNVPSNFKGIQKSQSGANDDGQEHQWTK